MCISQLRVAKEISSCRTTHTHRNTPLFSQEYELYSLKTNTRHIAARLTLERRWNRRFALVNKSSKNGGDAHRQCHVRRVVIAAPPRCEIMDRRRSDSARGKPASGELLRFKFDSPSLYSARVVVSPEKRVRSQIRNLLTLDRRFRVLL